MWVPTSSTTRPILRGSNDPLFVSLTQNKFIMTETQLLKVAVNKQLELTSEDFMKLLGNANVKPYDGKLILNVTIKDKPIVIFTDRSSEDFKSMLESGCNIRLERAEDLLPKKLGNKMQPARQAYRVRQTLSDLLG